MKLALGTVQFGLDYGVSNTSGKVAENEAAQILTLAQQNDIDLLDTGSVYGNSEAVIGQLLKTHELQFKIVDKVPDLETYGLTIRQALEQSLQRLQLDGIDGLMLHNAADLDDKTYKELTTLKDEGLINKIGISVYHPKPTFELEERFDLDLVQLPMNLFDQRFVETGCIDWLKQKGVEIHARSIFLQGLLLMDVEQLPPYFLPYRQLFEELDLYLNQVGLSRLAGALSLAHQHEEVDRLIVGVCSAAQLQQVVDAYNSAKDIEFDSSLFSCHEEGLISPFLWPQERQS